MRLFLPGIAKLFGSYIPINTAPIIASTRPVISSLFSQLLLRVAILAI
jgi:hypothetical protein